MIKRKWNPTTEETVFETLLNDNGFEIVSIKEHATKTDFLISKNGIIQEYSFQLNGKTGQKNFEAFVAFYNIRAENERIKKLIEERK